MALLGPPWRTAAQCLSPAAAACCAEKVLPKLKIQLSRDAMEDLANAKPGCIESFLMDLQDKVRRGELLLLLLWQRRGQCVHCFTAFLCCSDGEVPRQEKGKER